MTTTTAPRRTRRPRTTSVRTASSRDLSMEALGVQQRSETLTIDAPRRSTVPVVPHRKRRTRLGSQEVVSKRGRRIERVQPLAKVPRLVWLALAGIIGSVIVAMWLSGMTIKQSFAIQELVAQESQLSNEIETLNRDLHNASGTAAVAKQASERGMVMPDQPGILSVDGAGKIEESRSDNGQKSPLVDVNAGELNTGRASSDPEETQGIGGQLAPVPQGEQGGREAVQPASSLPANGLAPYANVR